MKPGRKRRFPAAGGHRAMALIELIVAIGTLAAVSVVVMQMFVRAAQWENRARDLDMARLEAQSAVEVYRASGTIESSDLWERPVRAVAPDQWVIRYDAEWRPAEAGTEKGYTLSATVTPVPGQELRRIIVTATRHDPHAAGTADEVVFTLDTVLRPRGENAG